MPPGVYASGLESNGADQFFCGGGKSGKVRAIRRLGEAPLRAAFKAVLVNLNPSFPQENSCPALSANARSEQTRAGRRNGYSLRLQLSDPMCKPNDTAHDLRVLRVAKATDGHR